MQLAVEEIGKYRPECFYLVKSFRRRKKEKKKKSMACNDCHDCHDCHGNREALVYGLNLGTTGRRSSCHL